MDQFITKSSVISWFLALLALVSFYASVSSSGNLGKILIFFPFIFLIPAFIIRIRTGSFVTGSALALFGAAVIYIYSVALRIRIESHYDLTEPVLVISGGIITICMGAFMLIKKFKQYRK